MLRSSEKGKARWICKQLCGGRSVLMGWDGEGLQKQTGEVHRLEWKEVSGQDQRAGES